jgi:hypothetical protein
LQAIEGYRETEKPVWGEANTPVIHRLKQVAEGEDVRALDEVHVLDLANDGLAPGICLVLLFIISTLPLILSAYCSVLFS